MKDLARTIAASKVPVISAIGHETDFTICDFVADRRAATPSEAAEIVVAAKQELDDRLLTLHKRLLKAAQYRLLLARNALSRLTQHPSFARMKDSIARREQRLDDRLHRMVRAEAQILTRMRRQLELLDSRLRHHDMRIRLGNVRRELSDREAALSDGNVGFPGPTPRSLASTDRIAWPLCRDAYVATALAVVGARPQPPCLVTQSGSGARLCVGVRRKRHAGQESFAAYDRRPG